MAVELSLENDVVLRRREQTVESIGAHGQVRLQLKHSFVSEARPEVLTLALHNKPHVVLMMNASIRENCDVDVPG